MVTEEWLLLDIGQFVLSIETGLTKNVCLLYYELCFRTKYQPSPLLSFLKYTSSSVIHITLDKMKIHCQYIAKNFFEFLSQIGKRLLRNATITIFSPYVTHIRNLFNGSYFNFAFVWLFSHTFVHSRLVK